MNLLSVRFLGKNKCSMERIGMLELKQWSLKKREKDGIFYANGHVYGHYRLNDGDYIYTSYIVNFYLLENGVYVFETHSGSLYQLSENEMQAALSENTKRLLGSVEWKDAGDIKERLERVNDEFTTRRKARENAVNNAKDWAEANLGNRELYLVMESMKVLKAFYKQEKQSYEIPVNVHSGMFQDSILITDWEQGNVDFRFFPNFQMEPYHWSDGLEKLHIYNIDEKAFGFKGTDGEILCEAGKITIVEKSAYRGEGLFSPDAVNGKCVFFHKENQNE